MQQSYITKTALSTTRNNIFLYKNLGIKFTKTTKKSANVQKNYAKSILSEGAFDQHKNTQDCVENFNDLSN
jgi:LAS superfamily LD-carboxypeptidase LdcB